ncbi:MAG: BREX-4 system phosphatase PglZ [Oscillibacter sp.]|nr:BREX-4 system phosphatase PglZ [Oscillibacter sp.]
MQSGNVLDCLEKIQAYCGHEDAGHALLVNVPTYDAYHEILNRLAGKERVSVAGHCLENGLPRFDEILSIVRGAGSFVLTGLSQAALLRGAPYIDELMGELFQMPVRGHAVILLEHMREFVERYLNARRDIRLDRQFLLLSGEESPLPRVRIARAGEPLAVSDALPNMRAFFQRLEDITDSDVRKHREIVVLSPFTSMVPFCNSLYSVRASEGVYASLAKAFPELAVGAREDYGDEAQWAKLTALLSGRRSFAEWASGEFEEAERLPACLGDVFGSGDAQRQWLLWLSMKVVGVRGNRYLSAAVENSASVEDFRKRLYMDILNIDCHSDAFARCYAERKRILRELPPNPALVGAYCEELAVGAHGRDTPYYLTDATEQEELEFVRCLHRYDYSEAELSELTKRTFPEVALYLRTFAFNDANMKVSDRDAALRERLTTYFQRYKLQKLRNRIDPDFLSRVESVAGERPYNKLPTRSALVARIPKKDTRLFFFDALGVEYLSYIQAKCDEYGLTAEISVGHCELPSITVNNKEFVDAFPGPPYDIKELDELKHHSRVIDYQKRKEPVHLFRELEIIDRHLQSIRTGLQREAFRRAAVVADHGASRLAVIYGRESGAPIQLDEKAEHSGRCCPAGEDPRIPFAAWENGFAVLANYERFRGGRKANVEVHGGASLEETLVPVIVISQKTGEAVLRFVDPVIELRRKEDASIVLYSSVPMTKPRMLVNERFYEGVFIEDRKHIRFTMPDMRRTRDYSADIYDGDTRVQAGLSFRVQKNIARDVLEL